MTTLILLGIVQTTIGYLGIVILCCTVLVWLILRKPERFNLDEESEALREWKDHKNWTRKFYCNKEPGKELCDTQCLHCKIVESKSKGK